MGNRLNGKDVHGFMRSTRIALAVALAFPVFSTPARADVANGEQIVRNICASCHGFPPIGGPNLAANNPSLIQFALNTVPAMSFLRGSLTQNDINGSVAIAALGGCATCAGLLLADIVVALLDPRIRIG